MYFLILNTLFLALFIDRIIARSTIKSDQHYILDIVVDNKKSLYDDRSTLSVFVRLTLYHIFKILTIIILYTVEYQLSCFIILKN